MELPDAEPLSQLATLDQDRVHLFVAGPGTGEAIAVHLPNEGWLLLDAATVNVRGSRHSPTVSIVEAWSDRLNCNGVRWFIVPVTGPLSPIWAFAFDNAGQCTGRWCGPAATLLSLHPPAP